ncbi:MAG: hypothetical protein FJ271_25450 [Planctomycetes bacterium]|nr:hypothetical protein [Planctomycetota bacterium]
MRGFVNSFIGADYIDVHGWAVHLRQQFPDRQDMIDAAMHLPIAEDMRQKAVRRIVEAQIDAILADAAAAPYRPFALDPADPAKTAARVLARVGDAAIEHYARRLGVTPAVARQKLLERLSGGAD